MTDINVKSFTIGDAIEARRKYNEKALAIKRRAYDEGRDLTSDEFSRIEELVEMREMCDAIEGSAANDELHLAAGNMDQRSGKNALGRAILTNAMTDAEYRDIAISDTPGHYRDPRYIDNSNFVLALKAHPFAAKAGARIETFLNKHQWPVETASATYDWQASEGTAITPDTSLTIGSKKVEYKTVGTIVKFSEQLLRDEAVTPSLIQQALVNGFMAEIERVALSGASGSNEPVGLDTITGVLTVDAAGTIGSYAKIIDAIGALHAVNVDPSRLALVTGTTAMKQIISLADTTNQPLMQPPVVKDMPFHYTSAVLESYDTSTHTRAYVGDWSQLVIAISGPQFRILDQTYAANLQRAVLMWAGVDVVAIRPNNFCRIENIDLA